MLHLSEDHGSAKSGAAATAPPIPPIFHINSTEMTATSSTATRTSTTSPVFQLGEFASNRAILPPSRFLSKATAFRNRSTVETVYRVTGYRVNPDLG